MRMTIVRMPQPAPKITMPVLVTGDVTITREEIGGLMAGLLATGSPPAGPTRLTDWAREHRDSLGVRYASELARRRDRVTAYSDL